MSITTATCQQKEEVVQRYYPGNFYSMLAFTSYFASPKEG